MLKSTYQKVNANRWYAHRYKIDPLNESVPEKTECGVLMADTTAQPEPAEMSMVGNCPACMALQARARATANARHIKSL
jgi:hypothetical protein